MDAISSPCSSFPRAWCGTHCASLSLVSYRLTPRALGTDRLHLDRFERALRDQPQRALLPAPYNVLVPAALFIVGQTFVITSTWALGIIGTFLGDYFGILMDHRVEGFPFNVLQDPMYVGSTMCFAAGSLWCVGFMLQEGRADYFALRYEKPAGLVVTVYVYVVYLIALRFEG